METFLKDEMENIVIINEKMKWKTFFKDEMETLFSLMKR